MATIMSSKEPQRNLIVQPSVVELVNKICSESIFDKTLFENIKAILVGITDEYIFMILNLKKTVSRKDCIPHQCHHLRHK